MAEPIAPAASGVGATLTRKVGPLPVWAYAVVAGVVLFAVRAHVGGLSLPGILGGGTGSGGGGGEGPSGGSPDAAAIASPGAFISPPSEPPLAIAPPRSSPPTTFTSPAPTPTVAGPQRVPVTVVPIIRTTTTPTTPPPTTTSTTLARVLSPTVAPAGPITWAPGYGPSGAIVASPRSAAAPVTVDPVRAALGTLPLTPAQQAALGVAPLSPEARAALGTAPLTPAQQTALGVAPLTGAAAAAAGFAAPVNLNTLGPINISSSGVITPRTIEPPTSYVQQAVSHQAQERADAAAAAAQAAADSAPTP